MNRAYGVRIAKAFVSDENWYRVNAFGGTLLLVFGVFLLVFAFLASGSAPHPTSPWAPVFLVAPLLVLIPVVVLIQVFARRLPDR